jgi:hypothetical protein
MLTNFPAGECYGVRSRSQLSPPFAKLSAINAAGNRRGKSRTLRTARFGYDDFILENDLSRLRHEFWNGLGRRSVLYENIVKLQRIVNKDAAWVASAE